MKNYNPIIIELLRQRGISEEADIAEFLSEKPRKTYDPFLLPDMEEGVDLILSKINQGSKICIYGDYDADGITAIALLWHVLSKLTDNLTYYIPSRFDEGYGLNREAISAIKNNGTDLIVTVDCGSVSYDEVEFAKEIGLDIVVTDHHSITDKLADCILINPKRSDCSYPCKDLAGVGVAFKLAQAIRQKANLDKSVINGVLDLVAIGTIGDIVPLTDENRTLVKYGIAKLNQGKRSGLNRLTSGVSLKPGEITAENIAYVIVPHLNAAGRMLSAKTAAELLISSDADTIEGCTKELIEKNRDRKRIQEEAYKACINVIEKNNIDDNVIIINSDDIHEGIAGIVAGKLKEKYDKPAIIVTSSGDDGSLLKGTGRSIEKINLYQLLKTCEDLFEKFGGHAGACGFTMKKEKLDEFRRRINDKTDEMLSLDKDLFMRFNEADLELTAEEVSIELAQDIDLMQPFGNKNPKPVFRIPVMNVYSYSTMGQDGQHVRFTIRNPRGPRLNCVMFNGTEEFKRVLNTGKPFYIVGTLSRQIWNGTWRLQIIVSCIEDMTEDA